MSYNPVRAANFYRNTSKARRRNPPPGSGTKHSDILKRQGVGQTVPLNNRTETLHGVGAPIFEGGKFVVRSEVMFAGNATDYGVNEKNDRVYQVNSGVLFATVKVGEKNEGGEPQAIRDVIEVQAGGTFRAPKGLEYSVATSTGPVELLIIEDKNYDKNWKRLSPGVSSTETSPVLAGATPDRPVQHRRRDQSKAKAQAETAARSRGARPQTGGKIGRNTSIDANAANVRGTNPMPAGPGAYSDND